MIHSQQATGPALGSPEAAMNMQAILDMAGEQLDIGQKVWVDMPHMADWFPGAVMYAEVIKGHREPQAGMVFVRQLPTTALPNPGEEGGWVSEQPATRCLGR
jgi:alkylation response protein AidB-like acyl-CoA dehydrogenase